MRAYIISIAGAAVLGAVTGVTRTSARGCDGGHRRDRGWGAGGRRRGAPSARTINVPAALIIEKTKDNAMIRA